MPLPLDTLEKQTGKACRALLKDSSQITGTLTSVDKYMNVVIDDAEVHYEEGSRKLGTLVLRGGNLVSISVQD